MGSLCSIGEVSIPDLLRELRRQPVVPPGVAASLLRVSNVRLWQLIQSGRLGTKIICGARFVSVSTIVLYDRQRQKRQAELVKRRQRRLLQSEPVLLRVR